MHKTNLLFFLLTCWFLQGQDFIVNSEIIENYATNRLYELKQGKPSKILVLDTLYRDGKKDMVMTTYSFKGANHFSIKKYVNNSLTGYMTMDIDSIGRIISYTDSLKTGYSSTKEGSRSYMTRIRYRYKQNKKIAEVMDDLGEPVSRQIFYRDSLENPVMITWTNIYDNTTTLKTVDYDYDKGTFVVVDHGNGVHSKETEGYINVEHIIDKNEAGDISKMFGILSKKGDGTTYDIDYTYDEYGNWIRMIKTICKPSEPKRVVSKTYRKIKYIE